MRAAPTRGVPVLGCVDKNFLGPAFYERNKKDLLSLKMNCLIRGGRIVDFATLRGATGLEFSQATYMHLRVAANFAILKYSGKNGSNGTCLPASWWTQQFAKGSGKFRKILDRDLTARHDITNMRVVTTFFSLIDCHVPDRGRLALLYGCWSWSFLSNKIRWFCFQYVNNSLGVGARVAARYRNRGIEIDQRCAFCIKSGNRVPMREEFVHIFHDCPSVLPLIENVGVLLFPHSDEAGTRKQFCMAGVVPNSTLQDQFFFSLSSLLFNYCLWQYKLKRAIPSAVSLANEIDFYFENIVFASKKIANLVTINGTPICRRWRAVHGGRG